MIDGDIEYLSGVVTLSELRHEVGAYENDPDFLPFLAILAELDRLGIGRKPETWSPVVFESADFKHSTLWAKEISLEQCRSLARRYSHKHC